MRLLELVRANRKGSDHDTVKWLEESFVPLHKLYLEPDVGGADTSPGFGFVVDYVERLFVFKHDVGQINRHTT